jgi:hypothetical protein
MACLYMSYATEHPAEKILSTVFDERGVPRFKYMNQETQNLFVKHMGKMSELGKAKKHDLTKLTLEDLSFLGKNKTINEEEKSLKAVNWKKFNKIVKQLDDEASPENLPIKSKKHIFNFYTKLIRTWLRR